MAWEYDTWIIERAEIIALEPALVVPPDIVAYSPGEGTVDPDAVTEISVNAPRAGATVLEQTRFDAITTETDHMTGFSTHAGTTEADMVALAVDDGAKSLEEALGAFLSVATSPATSIASRRARAFSKPDAPLPHI